MKKGYVDVEIKQLVKADWNYKEENKILTEKLTENIKRNGQIENLLIRELDTGFFEVVNGNHRLDVMKELKLKKAHCYNFGKITQTQASRIAIETNETKFKSDPIKLSEIITELNNEFDIEELQKTLPYTEDEIKNMLEVGEFNWDNFEVEDLSDTFSDDKFDKTINVKVSEETYKRWLELKMKIKDVLGYDNESKVMEFAIIETLNIPIESLK
ncbi:MAG: hypothetical protein Unbinned3987contig1001_36 [Prokaryotic dsDNA virus sp.]|jgi:hypothetical protein|nr:MAG: hypothetical protein Unbinned3987contig1001_36 [Prokaryotic dsDNA virus sp.]|tara:strand:+ start:110 stop:751 length:642 start_codon:yes stop_codon:yes gene_type:complete